MKLNWPLMVRRVSGHSMVPVLPPGTLVIGWKFFRNLKPNDIVIFLHDGKEKIKRISTIESDKLFLLGDHEDASTDSRHFGLIDQSLVCAKVILPHSPKVVNG